LIPATERLFSGPADAGRGTREEEGEAKMMDGLAEVAHLVGVEWAQHVLTILEHRAQPIPVDWPGTPEEAIAIAESFAMDGGDRVWLAEQLLRMAEDAWRDFVCE
jgi:hypothetical protein